MIKSNLHSHSRYDDGYEELESYIESALEKGFGVYGFSAHAPVVFENNWNMKLGDLSEYLNTINDLKVKYKDRIEIHTGLETDFYPNCVDWRNKTGIEYTIGAVHFLKNEQTGSYMDLDGTKKEFELTLKEGFNNDIHALFRAYFAKIRKMLLKMPPNIIAHLDVIKKNNTGNLFFKETDSVYQDEIMKTLELIYLTDTIVEINTGGLSRGYVTEPYPSRWILENCHDMGIQITVNSDSHHPDNIDYYYDEIYAQLKEIGYKKQRILYKNVWQNVRL